MKIISFIALGGALGTLFRYFLNHLALYSTFPIWTMFENIIGSFLLGILTGYVLVQKLPEHWKNGLGVGLCGSFTTMSTFAFDTYYLFHVYNLFYVGMYMIGSLLWGVIMAMLGMYAGQKLAVARKEGMRP